MKIIAIVVSALVAITAAQSVAAQSAKEKCLRAAQTEVASCQASVPPNVTPKDPKNPTSSEKSAMTKHTEAWKACNSKAQSAMTKCQ